MIYIKQFIENEKMRKQIIVNEFENGYKYVVKNDKLSSRIFHSFFKPLSEIQINKLQSDVNNVQNANYAFPKWYRDFLTVSNGMNLFMGVISFYGEQTPVIKHSKFGEMTSLIEKDNPNWMAPYNLRFTNSIKFNDDLQNRWLVIGCYGYDGTQIAWDYKKNKIVAMYPLPINLSIKKVSKMKEADYEKMIICEWDTFESFFISEIDRISNVFNSFEDLTKIDDLNDDYSQKSLPLNHKEHLK